MNSLRRLFSPVAAVALATGTLFATAPIAAAGTPAAELAADTPAAEVSLTPAPGTNPKWRAQLEKAKEDPELADRIVEAHATSPAMDNLTVPLVILKAKDNAPGRPIMYLLNGADGGQGGANWVDQSDALHFFANKDVNVVIPMGGAFSYYSDWVSPGGHDYTPKWETFLTKELPGPLEKTLNANSKRGIVGLSMSATSTLLLAQHNPGFYDGVGSFSGCAATESGLGRLALDATMNRGKGDHDSMWGPTGSETSRAHDALQNAKALEALGGNLYVSSATGLPDADTLLSGKYIGSNFANLETVVLEGGVIEGATNACTHDLKAKMDSYGIPAHWAFRPTGAHTWLFWERDLRDSWPMFAQALGVEEGPRIPTRYDVPLTTMGS